MSYVIKIKAVGNHIGKDGKKQDTPNIVILKTLEFGDVINNIPPRFLITRVVKQLIIGKGNVISISGDEELKGQKVKAIITSVVKRISLGFDLTANDIEEIQKEANIKIATIIVKAIKKTIENNINAKYIDPKNAKSTIEKKGFDHPYFETGSLKESITFEVTSI